MKLSRYLPLLLATGYLLSGCGTVRQQAYYVSPFNGHPSDYHPLPQITDSAHTAIYVHAAFLNGGANEERTDGVTAFRTSVSVAHHSGILQAYYGGDLTLGNYHAGKWDTGRARFLGPRSIPPANADFLNSQSGEKSFGGVGFDGGINLVMPTRGGEWRYLGLETSLHQEFGNYLSFRRHLPDTTASLIVRNPFFATLGITTEIVGRTQHGEFGFRFATGWALGRAYQHTGIHDNESDKNLNYGYGSFSFHYTYERYTSYVQFNGATKARSINLGVHYRLTRPRNPPHEPRHYRYRDQEPYRKQGIFQN